MTRGTLRTVVALAALPGVVHAAEPPDGRSSVTLTVLAAASLTDAFRALGDEFRLVHPGVRIEFEFAGTPTLVRQVEEGAPADVVAAADEVSMERLAGAGRLAGAASVFARNRLAILVAAGNPRRIGGLRDLARPGLVVALCAPGVPAGRYAAEALARAGVDVPEASREADVRAVVTRVALGEADAGIVYATDVRAGGENVQAVDIPEAHDVVARYPIAVLRDARARGAADEFVAFVLSAPGQATLRRSGFLGR